MFGIRKQKHTFPELSRKYRGTKMRHLRGQFLRACRLRLQTVSLPASGQKIFKYLHDSRQRRTDLRLQTWFVIFYHPTIENLSV